MIEIIFAVFMFIVVSIGMFVIGRISGRGDYNIVKEIGQAIREEMDKALVNIQGEFTDLDAISCTHPTCGRRKPQSKASFESLKAVGIHAVKEELDRQAEKINNITEANQEAAESVKDKVDIQALTGALSGEDK